MKTNMLDKGAATVNELRQRDSRPAFVRDAQEQTRCGGLSI